MTGAKALKALKELEGCPIDEVRMEAGGAVLEIFSEDLVIRIAPTRIGIPLSIEVDER